ncbi:type II pantothenate kinase [Paenibacillus sacheonensis]|uniref:Type II pantothenate kinase n=1 Tax=Paenibacillus sacheonensis TaxID=742054 RepID=A0A7X5C239_9BACL|nr:type II pantothenate kinase [Paenibacillus sacheonensis]MBM7567215.1 type II pantothenate kinase [Paenibacillus sacheonensis]NBC70860.1 type II pantothenate kinase [Paenibacillus sacheonensis]
MRKIGIDAGGTLIKLASMDERGSLELRKVPVREMSAIAAWLNGEEDARIVVTGGRSAQLKAQMNKDVPDMAEFMATMRGASYLLREQAFGADAYVLTNVGTGTSIHRVEPEGHARIGGTGVGGGTLMGLSRLLTGIADFETIVASAKSGTRGSVDLKVSDIYAGSEPPIPGELTASNFAKLFLREHMDDIAQEDLIASVMGLVGETVATTSVLAAGQNGISNIVYIGSSFIRNEPLRDVVRAYTVLRGGVPYFPDNGEYCGAIGALLSGK